MDRLLTESRLGGLGRKTESYPIRDVAAPLPLRDEATAATDRLMDRRDVPTETVAKSSAAFTAFFCEQTIASARVALFAGVAAWIASGASDFGHETQVPAIIEHRSLVAIPAGLAVFAASYLSLAQPYWQTFLTVLCVIHSVVIFSAAWVSYKTETPFDLEKWVLALILMLGLAALIPLRFFNAIGIGLYAAALSYLFLFLTNELLLSTVWMQALVAIALFGFCAVAYFRERLLWALFQFTEA
jgi:hypothetical protein